MDFRFTEEQRAWQTIARKFADDLNSQAHESLALFGERARRLIELTDFITHRQF